MATTITAAETIDHLNITWHDDVDTLEKAFLTALGHEITYTRVGEIDVQRFGLAGDLRHLYRLITKRGRLTRVERSANGVSLSLTIDGVHTSVRARHPVADATRFALTVH